MTKYTKIKCVKNFNFLFYFFLVKKKLRRDESVASLPLELDLDITRVVPSTVYLAACLYYF